MLSVQEKISLLMWDRRYLIIPSEIITPNDVRTVLLKDPSVEDKNYFLHVRRLEETKNRLAEVPTEGEVFAAAREAGFWSEEDEKIIREAEEHIQFLESEIERQKFAARKKSLRAQVLKTENQLKSCREKENYIRTNSAEYLAHEIATFHLLRRVVLTEDGDPFWPTDREFLVCKNQYQDFMIFLAHHVLGGGIWDTDEFREIARNPEWRLVWSLNREDLAGLFNKPVGDLSMNQKLLIYWSRVYDSVFEDPNRPENDIIEDNDRLDEWLANRDLERASKHERQPAGSDHQEQGAVLDGEYVNTCTCGVGPTKGKGLGESQRHDPSCPYGTFRQYTPEEKEEIARQIYGRNSDRMREYLDNEQTKVQKHGMVDEQNLRDKNARKVLRSNINVVKKYR